MSIIIKQAIWWQAAAYSPATPTDDFDPESPDNGMSSLELEPPDPANPADPAYYTSPTTNIVAGKFCGSLREFSLSVGDTDGDGSPDTVFDSATLGVRFGDPTLADARVVFKPSAAEATKIFGAPKPVVAIADFANVRVPLSYMLMGVYNSDLSQQCSDRSLPDSWFKHSTIPGDLVDPVSLDLLKQEMAPRVQTTSDGEDAGFFVKFPRQDDVTQIGCCGVIVEPPGSSTTSGTGQCTTGPTLRAYAGTPEKTRIWAVRAAVRGAIEANLPPDASAWSFTGPNPQELVYAEFDDEALLDSGIDTALITWHHAGFVVLEDNHGAFFPNDFCGGSNNDSSNLGNSYNYEKKLPVDIVDIAWDDRGWLWGICTGPSRTEGADLAVAPETTVDGLYRILPGGWTYVRADAISFGGHLTGETVKVTSRLVESRMGGGVGGFQKVSCGDGYTLYLTADGKVEFVSSTSSPPNTPPADVLSPDGTIIDIAASSTHAACIMADGRLRVWTMDGTSGVWLDGNDGTGFLKVACGNGITCAIKTNGDIQVWHPTVVPPVRTDPTKAFVQLDCGTGHVAGLTIDNDLFVSGTYTSGNADLTQTGVSAFACGDDCTLFSLLSAPSVIEFRGPADSPLNAPPTQTDEVKSIAAGDRHAVALVKPAGTNPGFQAWTWGDSGATLTGVPLTYGASPLSLDGQVQVFRAASCGRRHSCLITNGTLLEPRYSPARLIYRSKISLGSGVTVEDEPIAVVNSSPNTGAAIAQPQRCDSSTIILGRSDYADNPFDFTERVGLKIYDPSERTVRIIAARWRPHRLAVGTDNTNELSCPVSIESSSSHKILPSAAGLAEVSIPANIKDLKVLERPDTLGTVSYEDAGPNASFAIINNRAVQGNFGNLPVRTTSVTAAATATVFSSGSSGTQFVYSSNPVGDSRPFLPGNTLLHTVAAHVLIRYENLAFDTGQPDWAQVPSLLRYWTPFETALAAVPYSGASVGREYLRPPTLGSLPPIEIKRITSEWRLRCAVPEGEVSVAGSTSPAFTMNLPATVADDPDGTGGNFSSRLADVQVGGGNLTATGVLSTRFIAFDDFFLSFMSNESSTSTLWFWTNELGASVPMATPTTVQNANFYFFNVRHVPPRDSSSEWRVVDHVNVHLAGTVTATTQKRVLGAGLLHRWQIGSDEYMKGVAVVSSGALAGDSAHAISISHFTYKKPSATGVWGWEGNTTQGGITSPLQVFSASAGTGAAINVTTVNSQNVQSERHIVVGSFGIIMQNRQNSQWRCMYFPRTSTTTFENDSNFNPIATGTWVGGNAFTLLRPFVAQSNSGDNFVFIERGTNSVRDAVYFYGQNGLLSRGGLTFSATYNSAATGTGNPDQGQMLLGFAADKPHVYGCNFARRGDSGSEVIYVMHNQVGIKARAAVGFTTRFFDFGALPPFWPDIPTNGTADSSLPPRNHVAFIHSQDGQTPLLLLGDTVLMAGGTGQPRFIRVYKVETDSAAPAPVEYLGVLVFPPNADGTPFNWSGQTLHTTSDGRLAVNTADQFWVFDIVYNESVSASADPSELKSVRAVHYYPNPSRESINEDEADASAKGTPLLLYLNAATRQYPVDPLGQNRQASASGENIGSWAQFRAQNGSIISFENTREGLRIYNGAQIVAKILNGQIRSRRPGAPSLTSGGLYFSGQTMPMQAPWGNMWANISVGTRIITGSTQRVLFVGDYFGFFDSSNNSIGGLTRERITEDFIWITEFNARRAQVSRADGQTVVTALPQERIAGQLPYTRVKEKYRLNDTLYYPLGSGTPIKVEGTLPTDQNLWVYWGRKIFKIGTQANLPIVESTFDISSIGSDLERWFHSPLGDTTEGYSDYLDGYVTSAAGKNILVIANSRCRYQSVEDTANLDPGRMEIAMLGWNGSTWTPAGSIMLNSGTIPEADRGVKYHPDSYLPQRLSLAVSEDGLIVCVAGHVWEVDEQGLPRNSRISVFAKKKGGYQYQVSIPNPSADPIINFASRMEIAFEGGGKYRLNAYSPLDLAVSPTTTVDTNAEYSPHNTVSSYLIDAQGVAASVIECNDLVAAGDVNFDNSAAANLNHWVASPSPAFDGMQSASWAGNLLAITTLNRLMMLKSDRSNWSMQGHKDRPYLFNEVDVLQANFSSYKDAFTCADPGCALSTGTIKLPSPANGKQALDGRVRASFFVPNATTQPNQQGFYQIDNSAGTEAGWFTAIKTDSEFSNFSHFRLGDAISETAKPSPGEPLFDPAVQGAFRQVPLSGTTTGEMTAVGGNSPCTVRRPLFATLPGGTGEINWPFTAALRVEPRYLLRSDEPTTLRACGISGLDMVDAGAVGLTRNAQNILVLKDGMDMDSKGNVQPSLTQTSWPAGSKRVTDGGQLVSVRVEATGIVTRSFTKTGIFPESGGTRVNTISQRFGIKRPAAITVGGVSACGAGAFDIARPSRSPFAPFEGRAGGSGAAPWLLVFERHGFDAPYFSYSAGDFGVRTLSVGNPDQIVHADPFSVDPQAPFDPIGIAPRVGWCGGKAYPMGANSETVAEAMLRMLRGVFDPTTGAVFNSDRIALATSDSLVGTDAPATYQWSFPAPTGNVFSHQKCVCESTPLEAFEWLRRITRRTYTPTAQECALRVLHGAGTDPSALAPFFSRFQENGVQLKSLVFVLTCNGTMGDDSVNGTPMGSLDENTLRTWAQTIVSNLTTAGIFGAQSSVHFVDMVKRNTGSPYRRACEMLAEVSGGSYISLGRPWPSTGAT